MLREVRATPDVDAAAFTWMPLLQGWAPGWHTRVEGHVPTEGENVEIENNIVSPGDCRTMGIKVVEGRDFDVRDAFDPSAGAKEPNVAIVNRRFAERFFGHQSAVGRRFGVGEHADKLGIEIVGVVEDSLYAGPRNGMKPSAFFPSQQVNFPIQATFYVRSRITPTALMPALHRVVAGSFSSIPIDEMKTVERQLDDTLSTERLIASLSVVFAALATIMAALGLYGVMSFIVARRTKRSASQAGARGLPRVGAAPGDGRGGPSGGRRAAGRTALRLLPEPRRVISALRRSPYRRVDGSRGPDFPRHRGCYFRSRAGEARLPDPASAGAAARVSRITALRRSSGR